MYEYLLRFSPGEMIAIVAVVGGLIFLTAAILADTWQRARKVELEIKLKQDMLDRGMSADEIRTVLDAGKSTTFSNVSESLGRFWNQGHAKS
jgi:hypothetical protein